MVNDVLMPPIAEDERKIDEELFVINTVLSQLGRPKNLYRVNAERVWDNRYRVNIYCVEDDDRPVKSIAMTDSFFVTLTKEGIVSTPPIVRKYKSK